MAGLAKLVQQIVKIADSVTGGEGGLQAKTVIHRWTGENRFGTDTFAAPIEITGVVSYKQEPIKNAQGAILLAKTKIVYPKEIEPLGGITDRTEPIDNRDRIEIVGLESSVGSIIDVRGPINPETQRPFMLTVYLG